MSMLPARLICNVFKELLDDYFMCNPEIDEERFIFEIQTYRKFNTLNNIFQSKFVIPEVFIDFWEELDNPFNYKELKQWHTPFPPKIIHFLVEKKSLKYVTFSDISCRDNNMTVDVNKYILDRFMKLMHYYRIKNL